MYRAFLFLLFPDVAFVTIIILTNYPGSPKFLSFTDLTYRLFGETDGLENNRDWNFVRSIDRIPSFRLYPLFLFPCQQDFAPFNFLCSISIIETNLLVNARKKFMIKQFVAAGREIRIRNSFKLRLSFRCLKTNDRFTSQVYRKNQIF